MAESNGFGFSEADARLLSNRLEACLATMDETIEYVEKNCDAQTAFQYRKALGKVIADLYLNVAVAALYDPYPHLMPQPRSILPLDKEHLPPEMPLDLSNVPILELLTEALYRGEAEFIKGLDTHEPISLEAIDGELVRRSGGGSYGENVTEWVSWYLAFGDLSERDRNTLIALQKHKKILEGSIRPEDDEET